MSDLPLCAMRGVSAPVMRSEDTVSAIPGIAIGDLGGSLALTVMHGDGTCLVAVLNVETLDRIADLMAEAVLSWNAGGGRCSTLAN